MSVFGLQQLKATDPRTLLELLVKACAYERVSMSGRALRRQCPRTNLVKSWPARIHHWCVLKKESNAGPVSLRAFVNKHGSKRTEFVMFYAEKCYYNSVEKIQFGLISDKNIR